MTDQAIGVKLRRFQQNIRARKGLIGCGHGYSVALHKNGRILHVGTNRRGQACATAVQDVLSVAVSGDRIVLLCEDGTVCTAGCTASEETFAAGLSCVRRVAVGGGHIAALLGNGRVLLGGTLHSGIESIAEWPAVTDICCGPGYTAGLTADGRVLLAGGSALARHAVSGWSQIAGIFADSETDTLYAITGTGHLIATCRLPRHVRRWRGIVYVAAAGRQIRAVTATGHLLSTVMLPPHVKTDAFYVTCALSGTHALALTREGTVIASGQDSFGQCRTTTFGSLFESFEEFAILRRERESMAEHLERIYQTRHTDATRYARLLGTSERITACMTLGGHVLTSPSFANSRTWTDVRAIACGRAHIVALHRNGTVSADGNNLEGCCDVADWSSICAIAVGPYHTFGLTEHGHVRFCGRDECDLASAADWTGIRFLRMAGSCVVGVHFDGHLSVCGQAPFAELVAATARPSPVDICLTSTHLVALYADGRVGSTCSDASSAGNCGWDPVTADWQGIRAIAAAPGITLGLRYGGTVCLSVADTRLLYDLTGGPVSAWRHIVSIGCGEGYLVGLDASGRLHVAGTPHCLPVTSAERMSASAPTPTPLKNSFEAVTRRTNIMAVVCGPHHLLALDRDGQVLAAGADSDLQCTVASQFALFRDAKDLYRGRQDIPTTAHLFPLLFDDETLATASKRS